MLPLPPPSCSRLFGMVRFRAHSTVYCCLSLPSWYWPCVSCTFDLALLPLSWHLVTLTLIHLTPDVVDRYVEQCDEPKTCNAQNRGVSHARVCVRTHGRCTVCLCRRSWSSRRCSSPIAGCRCPCLHRSPPDMWYSDLQKSKRHTFIAFGW